MASLRWGRHRGGRGRRQSGGAGADDVGVGADVGPARWAQSSLGPTTQSSSEGGRRRDPCCEDDVVVGDWELLDGELR